MGEITTGEVETADGVWEGVTFIDWDGVGDTISRVEDDTGGTTRGVQGEDGLDLDVEALDFEVFEHDLAHLFTVGLGVLWSFGEENVVFRWLSTKFVVEAVGPDLLHVVPVHDCSVLDWIGELQNTTLGLGFVADVDLLGISTLHGDFVLWTTDDGWEDGTGCVVSGETGLGHTGSVIDNDGLSFDV